MNCELIPLDKLISRLTTDLHLADKYANDHPDFQVNNDAIKKNKKKYSILHYLIEYRNIISKNGISK